MKLETGDILKVTFDDPELKGYSTKVILLGKNKDYYSILTAENTIGLIDESNILINFGPDLMSMKVAAIKLKNWKGSNRPAII